MPREPGRICRNACELIAIGHPFLANPDSSFESQNTWHLRPVSGGLMPLWLLNRELTI